MQTNERKFTATLTTALLVLLAILLLMAQACTPRRPCKRGYEQRGDSCYRVAVKPSLIY